MTDNDYDPIGGHTKEEADAAYEALFRELHGSSLNEDYGGLHGSVGVQSATSSGIKNISAGTGENESSENADLPLASQPEVSLPLSGASKRIVYVLGPKNPDADAVCGVIAYAALRNHIDDVRVNIPKIAGRMDAQTERVLSMFDAAFPDSIENVTEYVPVSSAAAAIMLYKNWERKHENRPPASFYKNWERKHENRPPASFPIATESVSPFTPETTQPAQITAETKHSAPITADAQESGIQGAWAGCEAELILIGHNDEASAVENMRAFRIAEIIDCHKLGGLTTDYPVRCTIRPVGAVCTIIYGMYQESGMEPSRTEAGLLCAGIVSATQLFRTPESTRADKIAAVELAARIGVDLQAFAGDITV